VQRKSTYDISVLRHSPFHKWMSAIAKKSENPYSNIVVNNDIIFFDFN